eukprot:gene6925-10644_t
MRFEGWILYPLHISMKVVCQKRTDSVTRRVRLVNPTYERMLEVVKGWTGCDKPTVFYQDSDSDWVRVGTQLEWQECVRQFLQNGDAPVKLYARRSKKAHAAAAAPAIPDELVAIDDRWAGLEAVLKRELGSDVFDRISEGQPIACSWVNVRGGTLMISKRVLKSVNVPVTVADAATEPHRKKTEGLADVSDGVSVETIRTESIGVGPNVLLPECGEVATSTAVKTTASCNTMHMAVSDAKIGLDFKESGDQAMLPVPQATTSTNTAAQNVSNSGTNTVLQAITTASTNTIFNQSASVSTNTAATRNASTTSRVVGSLDSASVSTGTHSYPCATAGTNTAEMQDASTGRAAPDETGAFAGPLKRATASTGTGGEEFQAEAGDEYESDTFETDTLDSDDTTSVASSTNVGSADAHDEADASGEPDYAALLKRVREAVQTTASDEEITAFLRE